MCSRTCSRAPLTTRTNGGRLQKQVDRFNNLREAASRQVSLADIEGIQRYNEDGTVRIKMRNPVGQFHVSMYIVYSIVLWCEPRGVEFRVYIICTFVAWLWYKNLWVAGGAGL